MIRLRRKARTYMRDFGFPRRDAIALARRYLESFVTKNNGRAA